MPLRIENGGKIYIEFLFVIKPVIQKGVKLQFLAGYKTKEVHCAEYLLHASVIMYPLRTLTVSCGPI